jgi:hypothetical protein
MQSERRNARRERPPILSYIEFEPEGGGIILNISEQGLGFHAASTLRQAGPIQFCISPNPMMQIKMTAEIAWIDDTRKFGGLRFTAISENARKQVFQWLTERGESDEDGRIFDEPPSTLPEAIEPCISAANEPPELVSVAAESGSFTTPDFATPAALQSWDSTTVAPQPAPFSGEWLNPSPRPRLRNGLMVTCLILVLILTPIFLLQNLRHELGDSLINLGERLAADREATPTNNSPITVPTSGPNVVKQQAAPNPDSGNSTKETLGDSDSAASTPTMQGTLKAADSRKADHPSFPKYMANANSMKSRSAVARQLWASLGAGDSSAELPLAELYLAGDGVPRSCEQARILLEAASINGNVEARQWLKRVSKHKCR